MHLSRVLRSFDGACLVFTRTLVLCFSCITISHSDKNRSDRIERIREHVFTVHENQSNEFLFTRRRTKFQVLFKIYGRLSALKRVVNSFGKRTLLLANRQE